MRRLAPISLVAAVIAMAGCGGSEAPPEDPEAVLEQTFGGKNSITSGVLEVDLETTITAVDDRFSEAYALDGPVELPHDEAPRFDLTLGIDGAARTVEAGLTSSGEAGYLNLGERTYELESERFDGLVRPFREARAPFGLLDPSGWFVEPAVEGAVEVDGVETIQVSGEADVGRVLSDLGRLTDSFGIPGLGPIGRHDASATLDVFSGAEDSLLRRLDLVITLEGNLEGGQPFETEMAFSLALGDVNEPQRIETPADSKPIPDLEGKRVPHELAGLVEFLDDASGTERRR